MDGRAASGFVEMATAQRERDSLRCLLLVGCSAEDQEPERLTAGDPSDRCAPGCRARVR